MPLIDIKKDPSERELKWFGLLLALFFGIMGGIAWWHFDSIRIAWAVWGIAGTITFLYYVHPRLRLPIYLGWLYAAYPIGWTISHLILALIYYVMITGIGLMMRLFGYDPLNRRIDPGTTSYWKPHETINDPKRYFQQF